MTRLVPRKGSISFALGRRPVACEMGALAIAEAGRGDATSAAKVSMHGMVGRRNGLADGLEDSRSVDGYNALLLDSNMSCKAPGRGELTRTIKEQPEASAKVLQENNILCRGPIFGTAHVTVPKFQVSRCL